MADGFYGADVVQLRMLASAMDAAGNRLQSQLIGLDSTVSVTPWPGPDADKFRQGWHGSHSRLLRDAAAFLQNASKELSRNAEEQELASLAEGGSLPSSGISVPGLPLGEFPTPTPDDIEGKSAADIKDWWEALSPDQRQAFIREYPVEAGNTNGIPFNDRVDANKINTQNRIDWLKEHDPEPQFNPLTMDVGYPGRFSAEHDAWEQRQSGHDYLERVVDGEVQLAAYDPGNNSIVEMIGTFDENTSTVITYVPGTLTNEASFYGGNPQSVSRMLVDADKSRGTVAFVYKGSEFPDGDPLEAFVGEAKNDEFVAGSSPVLKDFQAAVDLERPSVAQTVGIGHSWGARNLMGSETDGARYDKLIALSGAAMPPGWVADPATDYSTYTYPDILLTAEANGLAGENFPMKDPAFEKHVYSPPGEDDWRDHLSGDNHRLIATAGSENDIAMRDVRKEIFSD